MIIYFTGTGNSRYVAEAIGILIDDKVVNANDYIKEQKGPAFTSDTPYIFVSPTYAWRVPRIFSSFIESCSFSGSNKMYFVMTCGTGIGNAATYIQKLCNKKGFDYKGVAEIVMPENYIAMFDVPDEKESEQIIADADIKIKTVAEKIKNDQALPTIKVNIPAIFQSNLVNPIFYKLFVSAKDYSVSEECIGCGKCQKLCPLNNIDMKNNKPVWGNACTHCMACICACPAEAIEYKKISIGKRRYYNNKKPIIK